MCLIALAAARSAASPPTPVAESSAPSPSTSNCPTSSALSSTEMYRASIALTAWQAAAACHTEDKLVEQEGGHTDGGGSEGGGSIHVRSREDQPEGRVAAVGVLTADLVDVVVVEVALPAVRLAVDDARPLRHARLEHAGLVPEGEHRMAQDRQKCSVFGRCSVSGARCSPSEVLG